MKSPEEIKNHNKQRLGKMAINFSSMEGSDLVKGKASPAGTESTRGNQVWIKQADGKWKYDRLLNKKTKNSDVEASGEEGVEKLELTTKKKKDIVRIVAFNGSGIDKVNALYELGVKDPGKLAQLTSTPRSTVLQHMLESEMEIEMQGFDVQQFKPALPPVDVKTRWKGYRLYLDQVATGINKSCIAYGTGGVGKTFNAMQVFENRGLNEFEEHHVAGIGDYDYIKITGKVTPQAMYKTLYEHNEKIIVFDDCDSVLKDETSVNILKGALDTSGDGTINYKSGKKIKDDQGEEIPQRFAFQGQVVFISNLTASEMPQPLISRSTTVDLSMTPSETMTMLKDISPKMKFKNAKGSVLNVPEESRQAAVDFMDKYKDRMNPDMLNTRTLQKVAVTHLSVADNPDIDNWEDYAMILISHEK